MRFDLFLQYKLIIGKKNLVSISFLFFLFFSFPFGDLYMRVKEYWITYKFYNHITNRIMKYRILYIVIIAIRNLVLLLSYRGAHVLFSADKIHKTCQKVDVKINTTFKLAWGIINGNTVSPPNFQFPSIIIFNNYITLAKPSSLLSRLSQKALRLLTIKRWIYNNYKK